MGRGRAKAKQTKVARELKYSTGGTDLEALRKELASAPPSTTKPGTPGWADDETDAELDADSDDEDDDADEDDDEYGASGSR